MITTKNLEFLEKNKNDRMLIIEEILIQWELSMLSHLEISNLNMKESIESRSPDILEKSKKELKFFWKKNNNSLMN